MATVWSKPRLSWTQLVVPSAQKRYKDTFTKTLKEEKTLLELTAPIAETYNMMSLPGETDGQIARFTPDQYSLQDNKTVMEEVKNLFNSFCDVDEATNFIDAVKRDLNRLNDITV